MKILNVSQIRQADSYTIHYEPISSADLMERAGKACFDWIVEKLSPRQKVIVYAGQGNNGGDGLVIARLLAEASFNVEVRIVSDHSKPTADFLHNLKRISNMPQIFTLTMEKGVKPCEIEDEDIVIDAIIGSGLSRAVGGFTKEVIHSLNSSKAVVISIDIPSGLFADQSTLSMGGEAVKADYTLSLQFPKLAFLFAENEEFVGEWHVIPIGLHPEFIRKVDVDHYLLEAGDLKPLLRKRRKFDHKGKFGHALLIAGSKHKMGAAILAARAALRSGVGLLTVHVPESGITAMHAAVPEAMVTSFSGDQFFNDLPVLDRFSAVAVGPGIGCNEDSAQALKFLIQNYRAPMILDADALNILAENPTWMSFLSPQSLLSPHRGEFNRLLGTQADDFDRNKVLREFCRKHQFITILKGAHSAIGCTDGYCFFNSTGNPGMATAGSGDVLTGLLLGLKAQGYESENAAILGVYLHGLAGDIAAMQRGYEGMTASDITESLPLAFNELRQA